MATNFLRTLPKIDTLILSLFCSKIWSWLANFNLNILTPKYNASKKTRTLSSHLNLLSSSTFRNRLSKFAYMILTAAVAIFFLEAFFHFVICALHLAFDISGLDDRRDDFYTTVSLLHHVVPFAQSEKLPLGKTFLWQQSHILREPDNDMRWPENFTSLLIK